MELKINEKLVREIISQSFCNIKCDYLKLKNNEYMCIYPKKEKKLLVVKFCDDKGKEIKTNIISIMRNNKCYYRHENKKIVK